MKPKSQSDRTQFQLFQAHFDQILNPEHPLIILANKIDWTRFDLALKEFYCEYKGAPALPTRLLVGLHYLKHAFDESDESVLERWIENPYWQQFCGFTTMQHELPLHPTSLVKWRKRIGADKLVLLLQETIAMAVRENQVSRKELEQVNVDTTVQEKNITYPTDSKLYYKALVKLAKVAKAHGIVLRQSYLRVGKRMAIMVGRYAHAKQFKRMANQLRKLKKRLGRVIRDLRRKAPHPSAALEEILSLCERLHAQKKDDKKKLYSLHEPEVMCISKGKAHKRYEFGQKISVVTSNRGNWILGVQLCRDNPYDGHTLDSALLDATCNTGSDISDAYVDKGYRGHGYEGKTTIHIAGSSNRNVTRTTRKRRRRRSAVEPIIGHMKSDNRMRRCFLSGLVGDEINAILSAAGYNLRKLLRGFLFNLFYWFSARLKSQNSTRNRQTPVQIAA